MDTAKINYIMDIFKTLSGELPDQMLYRETGDSIELKSLDDNGKSLLTDLQDNGWSLINGRMASAA